MVDQFQSGNGTQQPVPTHTISVGDREADIYELFALAAQTPKAPLLLVRAQHDRKLGRAGPFVGASECVS